MSLLPLASSSTTEMLKWFGGWFALPVLWLVTIGSACLVFLLGRRMVAAGPRLCGDRASRGRRLVYVAGAFALMFLVSGAWLFLWERLVGWLWLVGIWDSLMPPAVHEVWFLLPPIAGIVTAYFAYRAMDDRAHSRQDDNPSKQEH